jgi:Tol biopolymer transport system component
VYTKERRRLILGIGLPLFLLSVVCASADIMQKEPTAQQQVSVATVPPRPMQNGDNRHNLLFSACSERSTKPVMLDIFRAHPDGSGATNITVAPQTMEFDPVWSPDGRQIAYAVWDTSGSGGKGEYGGNGIYVMNSDGMGRRRITPNGKAAAYSSPSWSPDGRNLVFCAVRWLENTAGGYNSYWSVYRIGADGKGMTRLREGWFPSWSPDGRRILLTARIPMGPDKGQRALFLMDFDGKNLKRIISGPTLADGLTAATAGGGSWSPDGKRIIYSAEVGQSTFDLFLANADGSGKPERLTRTSAPWETAPQWSPDGKYIYYTRRSMGKEEDDSAAVRVIAMSNRQQRRLFAQGAFRGYAYTRSGIGLDVISFAGPLPGDTEVGW